jgi:uncharacterized protein
LSVYSGVDGGLEFEWDPAKAGANLRRHGITFDQAIGVFYDPLMMTIEDERFAYSEFRQVAFGPVDAVILAVVHVERREELHQVHQRPTSNRAGASPI